MLVARNSPSWRAHFTLFLATSLIALIGSGCSNDTVTVRGTAQPGEACDADTDCALGFECESLACAQVDPYRITLEWTVETDFDLHVRTPNGRELYFGRDNTQAYLGNDDCPETFDPGPEDPPVQCADPEGTHREHAFLRTIESVTTSDLDAGVDDTDDAGVPGESRAYVYEYWVDNYGCNTEGEFTLMLIARDETVEDTRTGTLPAACAESQHYFALINEANLRP